MCIKSHKAPPTLSENTEPRVETRSAVARVVAPVQSIRGVEDSVGCIAEKDRPAREKEVKTARRAGTRMQTSTREKTRSMGSARRANQVYRQCLELQVDLYVIVSFRYSTGAAKWGPSNSGQATQGTRLAKGKSEARTCTERCFLATDRSMHRGG